MANEFVIKNGFISQGTSYVSNGNLGIGTSTPTAKLQIKFNDLSTGNTVSPFSVVDAFGQNIFYLSNQNYYGNENRIGFYSNIYDNQFNIDLAGSSGQFKLNYGDSTFQLNPYPNAFGTRFLFKTNPGGGSGEAGIAHIFNGNPFSGDNQYLISEDLQVGTTSNNTGSTIVGKYIRKNNFNNPNTTFYPLIVMDGNVGFGTSTPTRVLDSRGTFNLQPSTNTFLRFDSFMLEAQVGNSNNQLILNRDNFGITDLKGSGGVVISNPTYLNSLSIGTNTILRENDKIVFSSSDNYVKGWWDIQNSRFRIGDGGYSPIYTSTTETFEVVGTSKITGNVGIGISGSTDVDTRLKIVGSDSSPSNYGLKVQNSGGTDNFVVRNDGKVGIGTSTPSYRVHIMAADGSNPVLLVRDNTNTFDIASINGDGYTTVRGFNIGTSVNTYAVSNYTTLDGTATIQQYNKNLYFTTTDSALENLLIYSDGSAKVRSSLYVGDVVDTTARIYVRGTDNTSSNYGLKVQNSGGTDNFVVRNDGNVGIGTATPTETLEVVGKTKTDSLQIYNPYIPTGSTDPTGSIGDISLSGDVLFWRDSTQWYRISGQTW